MWNVVYVVCVYVKCGMCVVCYVCVCGMCCVTCVVRGCGKRRVLEGA